MKRIVIIFDVINLSLLERNLFYCVSRFKQLVNKKNYIKYNIT
jgi:hypothetical protein